MKNRLLYNTGLVQQKFVTTQRPLDGIASDDCLDRREPPHAFVVQDDTSTTFSVGERLSNASLRPYLS